LSVARAGQRLREIARLVAKMPRLLPCEGAEQA